MILWVKGSLAPLVLLGGVAGSSPITFHNARMWTIELLCFFNVRRHTPCRMIGGQCAPDKGTNDAAIGKRGDS